MMRFLRWLHRKKPLDPRPEPAPIPDRAGAQTASLAALREGDLGHAAEIVVQFEAASDRPRGLNVKWDDAEARRLTTMARTIFSTNPGILAGIDPLALPAVRLAAAMQLLWGEGQCRRWLPAGLATGIRLDPETAARMLIFHTQNFLRIQEWKLSDEIVKRAGICTAEDSCKECRKRSGRRYRLSAAPELPSPRCTHSMGCRCIYLPVT